MPVPIAAPAPPPVRPGRLRRAPSTRQRLWTAMRVLKRFDVPLLMLTGSASARSVRDFLRALQRADAVRLASAADRGGDCPSYVLIGRPGPVPPEGARGRAASRAGTAPTPARQPTHSASSGPQLP
jgi:hypothetical protein